MDLSEIDIIAYLDDAEIPYKTKGKNVTRGWVNINCPFPHCGDPSEHCGINLKSNMFHCWKCNEKGSVISLLKELTDQPYRQILSELSRFKKDGEGSSDSSLMDPYPQRIGGGNDKIVWPKPLLEKAPPPHWTYLSRREFDPAFLTKKYRLKFTYNTGSYRFSIIAPVVQDKKEVAWIAADVLRNDDNKPPYLNAPEENCIIPVNRCLYNVDTVRETAIIVEGLTDVWRCGDGFVATFRKGMTDEQIIALIRSEVTKVFIMYDADAIDQSYGLADKLSGSFPQVSVLELEKGDPGDLTNEEINQLKLEINFS